MIRIGDALFEADRTGALWWPGPRTLVAADLHLEKGAAYARRGAFLPPYDTTETLRRLSDLISRRNPRRVILLGDSFHDAVGMQGLNQADRVTLGALQRKRTWIWITGNHDPEICDCLGGEEADQVALDELTFRHEPDCPGTMNEVAGHLHPCARIMRHGRSIRRPCFVSNGTRLIIPAFGAYTGGLNICDPAFDDVFTQEDRDTGLSVWMVGRHSTYFVGGSAIRPD
ncbi:MAG: ligase-associated DNA damage response endonuclease PdeM [Hyphomicrobiaceae bacterium]